MKMRVDLCVYSPTRGQWTRYPAWEWDGESVRELDEGAEDFREVTWERTYTPADGLDFLRILHKTVRGTFVAATKPYEVEE